MKPFVLRNLFAAVRTASPPILAITLGCLGACAGMANAQDSPDSPRPNIVWISSEDHGQEMGCYGDVYAETPNVDALAKRGLLYKNVWSCFPVCAPARTTIISGIFPTRSGAEHMRSMVSLPPGTKLLPTLMREAGYYCSNRSKEDYNVEVSQPSWNDSSGKAHWRGRNEDEPFFSVFNSTLSHESAIRRVKDAPRHDPAKVTVPAYHPDDPVVRRDWAIYYDSVTASDAEAGKILKQLEDDGLAESTIVFYWGDHGSGMPRSKRWPCDSGLRVPLVVYVPEALKDSRPSDYQAGGSTDRLVSFIDFAPTVLSLAGVQAPAAMDGRAIMGKYEKSAPEYMFGFRGRMDERLDLVRSVTDGRYVYLRNFMPHLSQAQYVSYQFETPTTAIWKSLYDQGKLNAAQSIFWNVPKAVEEFYDLQSDPDEVVNLASDESQQDRLAHFRGVLMDHLLATRDVGFIPEGQRRTLAQDRSIMEIGSDDSVYPLNRVLAAASLSSQFDDSRDETMKQLASLAKDESATIRYWGCLGLLMRGAAAIEKNDELLLKVMASDASPEVQVVAAQSLATFGSNDQRQQAWQRLFELADWSQESVFTVTAATRAIDEVPAEAVDETRREEILSRLGGLKAKGQSPDERYTSYVGRLIQSAKERWQSAAAVSR